MARKGLNSSRSIVTRLLKFVNLYPQIVRSSRYNLGLSMVAVAQLVESRIVIPVVVGSSPISHPKYQSKKACNFVAGFFVCHRHLTQLRRYLLLRHNFVFLG
jgi:hypothetical protein